MDKVLLLYVFIQWSLVSTRDIPDPGGSHENKSFVACDKEQLTLECPGSDVIVFDSATYGRTDTDVCGHATVNDCRDYSTVTVLNKLCMGRNSCQVTVDRMALNSWVCPLVSKYLEATYSCVHESAIYDVCDPRDITGLPAYVHSPEYPAYYPNSRHCILSLSPALADGAQATTLDVDLELHDAAGCLDYLLVREQHNPRSKFLYCGDLVANLRQQTVRMTRPQVEFESDSEFPYRGFLVKLTKSSPPETPQTPQRQGDGNPPARRLSAQQRHTPQGKDEGAQSTIMVLYFLVLLLASLTVALFLKMYLPVLIGRSRHSKNSSFRVY